MTNNPILTQLNEVLTYASAARMNIRELRASLDEHSSKLLEPAHHAAMDAETAIIMAIRDLEKNGVPETGEPPLRLL